MKLLLILLLLTSCRNDNNESKTDYGSTIYEVWPELIKECQTVFNDKEKLDYNHCRERIYFKCGFVHYKVFKLLKVFKFPDDANKYCAGLRTRQNE